MKRACQELPPIIGAYHVATFPGWQGIVASQCARMVRSGLVGAASRILVGIVGDETEFSRARDLLHVYLYDKADVSYCGPSDRYEFPTLYRLYKAAHESDAALFYLHTKGVSSGTPDARDHRKRMESVVLDNFRSCIALLNDYDMTGIDWRLSGFGLPNPHFGGNFWWARSEHIRRLPDPTQLDTRDRYQAEFWIGKCDKLRPFELHSAGDPFDRPSAWRGLEPIYRELCGFQDAAEVRCVVDVGVDYGHTTFQFASDFAESRVYGVSTFTLHDDSEQWVRSHVGMFPNVTIIKRNSVDCAGLIEGEIDLLHIDGDHEYDAVRSDFESFEPNVKKGGRVLFHDTRSFEGVSRFFSELPGRKSSVDVHYGLGCWYRD